MTEPAQPDASPLCRVKRRKQLSVPYEDRCQAMVWRRDQYRYTGRSKSGFTMHYQKGRCARRAVADGLCTQHKRQSQIGWNILRVT